MKFAVAFLAVAFLAVAAAQPTGTADVYAAREGNAVRNLNVLANDQNVADTILIASVDTTGTQGTVAISVGEDLIEYTPPANFVGADTFTYVIKENGQTNSAAVTVTVNVASRHPDRCSTLDKFDSDTTQCACTDGSAQLDTTAASKPTLDVSATGSRINNDQLHVVFVEPVRYYYMDGNTHLTAPKYNVPRGASGTNCLPANWAWTPTLEGCNRRWSGVIAWTDAYDGTGNADDTGTAGVGCGFTVDRSDADKIVFRLDFSVTTTEDLPQLDTEGDRNSANHPRTRAVTHKLPFLLEFPKQATATSGDVIVFSPYRTLAAITKQAVLGDPNQGVSALTLQGSLFTSVQWPFKLTTATHSVTKDNAGTTVSLRTGSNSGVFPETGGVVYSGNPVDVSATELPAGACDEGTSCDINAWSLGSEDPDCPPCEQATQFNLALTGQVSAGEHGSNTGETYFPCDFTGEYALKFVLACHAAEPAASACPLDTIDTDKNNLFIVLNIASSNHCPQLIDTVVFSSDLWTFETDADAQDFIGKGTNDQKDDFLSQQKIFFRGTFSTDDVSVSNVAIAQIKLLRPNIAAGNIDIPNFRTADEVIHDGTAAVGMGLPTTGLDVTNLKDSTTNDGSPVAPSAEAHVTFELTVDSDNLGLDVDEREVLQYEITVDLTYSNAGQSADVAPKRRLLKVRTFDNSRRATSKAVATVGGSASASTSNALFGVSVSQLGMAAGGLAAVAVVSVVVVLTLKKRRTAQLLKVESTTELATAV